MLKDAKPNLNVFNNNDLMAFGPRFNTRYQRIMIIFIYLLASHGLANEDTEYQDK